jgi:hypothetical protein
LPIEIGWQAPASCPQEVDLRKRIQNLLGTRRPASPLLAEGTIVRKDRSFRLQLKVQLGDLQETRSFESVSCEDLMGAAAVEVALLVQSDLTDDAPRASGRSPSQSRASEPVPSLTRPAESSPLKEGEAARLNEEPAKTKKDEPDRAKDEPPPAVEARPQRSWHALLQAPLLAVQVDSQGRHTVGGGLSLGLEHAQWQGQLAATFWPRLSVPAKALSVYGADIDRFRTDIWACREFRFAWLGLSPCLSAGLDRVSARGTGRGIDPTPRRSIGMSAGAGGQARLHMASWLRLVTTVGGHLNFSRPDIVIDGVGFVYRLSPAAFYAAIGLEWIL